MKEKILSIASDLKDSRITSYEAKTLLLGLFGVSGSVFVVCENDDYGRDLWLCCKNSVEEAKEVKGRDTTRNIYEHWIL